MFFKNATLFRIPASILQAITAAPADGEGVTELEAALAQNPLKPIGSLELATYGFLPALGNDFTAKTHTVGDNVLVVLGGETKIIPPSSVNSILAKRIDEAEQKEGRRPGGRARKRMKDEILQELLPKALTKPSRTAAIINVEHGYIAVDTASRKVAEMLVSALRAALGSFPALPINAEVAPRSVMTGWIAGEPLPDSLSLGEEAELRDGNDTGAVVRCRGQDLGAEEIASHLESGKQVTRLAVNFNDHVAFTIDEGLTLRKLRILDGAMDSLEDMDNDDLAAELDARLALMGAELALVFQMLEPAFKLSRVED
ncbi:MAG TPA: recombination-associated protein RdgC [Luteimonas sp.]